MWSKLSVNKTTYWKCQKLLCKKFKRRIITEYKDYFVRKSKLNDYGRVQPRRL